MMIRSRADTGSGILKGSGQLPNGFSQQPEQGIVSFDPPVQLTAVRDETLGFHGAGGDALVDRGLFLYPTFGMTAVVDAFIQTFV